MTLRHAGFALAAAAVLALVVWVGYRAERAGPRSAVEIATTAPRERNSYEPAGPGPEVTAEVGGADSTRRAAPATESPSEAVAADSTTRLIVRCVERGPGAPLAGVELSLLVRGGRDDVVSRETTDAAGTATIPVTADLAYTLHADGHRVEAAFEAIAVEPLAPGEARELRVGLRTGADLAYNGRVVDADSGAPVHGARVKTLNQTLRSGSIEDVQTDTDGRFRLQLPGWQVVTAAVTCESFGRILFRPGPGFEDPEAPEEISVARSGALYGRVLDAGGIGLDGVHIVAAIDGWRIAFQKDRTTLWGGQAPVWTVTTTADGSFRIEGLLARVPVNVALRAGERVPRKLVEAPLQPGEEREVEWRLGAGARILGAALDSSRAPHARVPIWLTPREPSLVGSMSRSHVFDTWERAELAAETETDADGRFLFEDVAPGPYWLGPGPAGGRYAHDFVPAAREIEIRASDTLVEVQLELRDAGRIVGRVQDGDGRPIDGLEVIAQGMEGDAWLKAPTDADGTFVLAGLEDELHLVSTGGFGNEWASSGPIQVRPGEEPLVIVLTRGGEIRGRVIDGRTGDPSEARVTLVRRETSADEDFVRTIANKPGTFELGGLVPGVWDAIAVRSDGLLGTARGIVVAAGPSTEGVELRLQRGGELELAYTGEAEWAVFNVYWEDVFLHNGALNAGEEVTLNVPAGRITARLSLPENGDVVRELAVGVAETKRLQVD